MLSVKIRVTYEETGSYLPYPKDRIVYLKIERDQ